MARPLSKAKFDFKALTVELESGEVNPNVFTTTKIPNTQMVQGNTGDYFYVDLKNQENKKLIYFPPGRYILDKANYREFSESLKIFYNDVINELQVNKYGVKIYIQGMADGLNPNFKNPFVQIRDCSSPSFASIDYFPSAPGGGELFFRNQKVTKKIGEFYGNTDLPYLRSLYLKCSFKTYEESKNLDVSILQGAIDPNVNSESRNATLIIFIPKQKEK